MAEGVQAVQPANLAAFSVVVMRAEEGFEYEIRDKAPEVSEPQIAEVLFSIAIALHVGGRAG
jgi:hypothetical protein